MSHPPTFPLEESPLWSARASELRQEYLERSCAFRFADRTDETPPTLPIYDPKCSQSMLGHPGLDAVPATAGGYLPTLAAGKNIRLDPCGESFTVTLPSPQGLASIYFVDQTAQFSAANGFRVGVDPGQAGSKASDLTIVTAGHRGGKTGESFITREMLRGMDRISFDEACRRLEQQGFALLPKSVEVKLSSTSRAEAAPPPVNAPEEAWRTWFRAATSGLPCDGSAVFLGGLLTSAGLEHMFDGASMDAARRGEVQLYLKRPAPGEGAGVVAALTDWLRTHMVGAFEVVLVENLPAMDGRPPLQEPSLPAKEAPEKDWYEWIGAMLHHTRLSARSHAQELADDMSRAVFGAAAAHTGAFALGPVHRGSAPACREPDGAELFEYLFAKAGLTALRACEDAAVLWYVLRDAARGQASAFATYAHAHIFPGKRIEILSQASGAAPAPASASTMAKAAADVLHVLSDAYHVVERATPQRKWTFTTPEIGCWQKEPDGVLTYSPGTGETSASVAQAATKMAAVSKHSVAIAKDGKRMIVWYGEGSEAVQRRIEETWFTKEAQKSYTLVDCGHRPPSGQKLVDDYGELGGVAHCSSSLRCGLNEGHAGAHGDIFRGIRGTFWSDTFEAVRCCLCDGFINGMTEPVSVVVNGHGPFALKKRHFDREDRLVCDSCAPTAVNRVEVAEAEWMRQKAIKDRLANEAGLVAFAAAPPPWAYPMAWKAAVIAEAEGGAGYQSFVRNAEVADDFRAALKLVHEALRDGRPVTGGKWGRGIAAYQHARPTAPSSPRPFAERRRRP